MSETQVDHSELHKQYILELESELREFESKEEAATKRMKLLVYPAMVAFFILSSYGFYLIHSLTNDIGKMVQSVSIMAESMDPMARRVIVDMDTMTKNIATIDKNIGNMVNSIALMSTNFTSVANDVKLMGNVMKDLSYATTHMQYDLSGMNESISKPLNMMNRFLPWGRSSRRSTSPIVYGYYPNNQLPSTFTPSVSLDQ